MRNAMRPFALCAVALAVAVGGCKKKAPDTGEPSPPAPAGGDRARLQGMWTIEALDDGSPATEKEREKLKDARLKFEGDTLTINERAEDIKFTFALDESKAPKVMTLTEAGERRPSRATFAGTKRGGSAPPAGAEPPAAARKWQWIYKFEGESLVVAFVKDGGDSGSAPTEFKSRKGEFGPDKRVPAITVITLKKTDVPAPPREPRKSSPTFSGTRK